MRNPKFRVGQIVVYKASGDPFKIQTIGTIPDPDVETQHEAYCYWEKNARGYVPERYLRPQNDSEIGLRRRKHEKV